MRIRYTPRARGDLEAIYNYLEERSSAVARATITRIERRIIRLGDFPFMAPATELPDIYELTLVRYPYKIYYRVDGNEIWIVHIRHTARQPWGGER